MNFFDEVFFWILRAGFWLLAAAAQRRQLGNNRDGNLGGGFAADIKAYGGVQAVDFGAAEIQL